MKTYAELTEEKKPVLPTPVPSNMQEGEEGDEGKFFNFQSQCGKFRIFLSLRFYVKSNSENLKVQKCHFNTFGGPNF